jgi:hypothetical protein
MSDPQPPRALSRRAFVSGLAAAPWAAAASTEAPPLWRSEFRSGLADWRGLGSVWGRENHQYVEAPGVAGRALRVHIRQGSIDPGSMTRRGLPRSGTGFKARVIDGGSDVATLEYLVRFPVGFDFVRGGKLPGLFGGTGSSGGKMPTGSDGFSTRLMWRERGAGEVYAYLPTSQRHGTSLLRGSFAFTPGVWHLVTQHVKLNTPGLDDGLVAMAIDRRYAGHVSGLRFRDTASLRLDGVFFDLFFGGSDDSWAARADTFVEFAAFAVRGAGGEPAG